jgi:hypothetical protein
MKCKFNARNKVLKYIFRYTKKLWLNRSRIFYVNSIGSQFRRAEPKNVRTKMLSCKRNRRTKKRTQNDCRVNGAKIWEKNRRWCKQNTEIIRTFENALLSVGYLKLKIWLSAGEELPSRHGSNWRNDMFTLLIFVKYKVLLTCLWSLKVLNFGNSLTLIVIQYDLFCQIFSVVVFKDNHTGSVAHINIIIICLKNSWFLIG